jgi:exopolysaccharide biosynthesis protein
MKFFKKPYAWAKLYTVILILFTLYAVLDTFIIPRAYTVLEVGGTQIGQQSTSTATNLPDDETDAASDTGSASVETSAQPVVTANAYSNDDMNITITEYREYETDIYVADVVLTGSEALKTAFAENTYGKNITEKTSEIASENNAILTINGDFYGAQTTGYVIRNGELYRSASSDTDQEDLVIWSDGSFTIINEGEVTAQELLDGGAEQVLSFGPALIEDGDIAVTKNDEVDKAMVTNPRTAIGIIDNLHYVMIVSDGRTDESKGLSLYQLADFMKKLGVETAYNLDGGGSSTMVFNGSVINNPTTNGKSIRERSVSDIVYIG